MSSYPYKKVGEIGRYITDLNSVYVVRYKDQREEKIVGVEPLPGKDVRQAIYEATDCCYYWNADCDVPFTANTPYGEVSVIIHNCENATSVIERYDAAEEAARIANVPTDSDQPTE